MMYRPTRRTPARAVTNKPPERNDPLSDKRYQDLLSKAGAFFAEAQRDIEGERAAAIDEILQTLERYGLTVEDLR